jgi:nicotinamidase-related amidase
MNALIVIDMQEGFRSKESEFILPTIQTLIERFNGLIIFTKFVNLKNSLFEKLLGWTKFQTEKDQKIFRELLNIKKTTRIIEHKGYTVLNNKLKKLLLDNNIQKVYLCGIYTNICVMKTAMDLFDSGFETFVVEDACASLNGKQKHDFAIDTLKHILGKEHIVKTKDCSNLKS